MRKLAVPLVLATLAWWYGSGASGPHAGAQETSGVVIFSRHRQFKIPFNAGAGTGRLKQLQLHYSNDQGRTWRPSVTALPDQGQFRFVAERDGLFWFTVQTTDSEGRLYPPSLENAIASLKVVIDTQPPVVNLHALAPRATEIGVSWDIRDDNLDLAAPDALHLEYRLPGSAAWLPVNVPTSGNQAYWSAAAGGSTEVRLRVRDRAGNVGEATTSVASAGGFVNNSINQATLPGVGSSRPGERTQPVLNGPTEAERRLVGSKRINLNYEIKDVGPSDISEIELWYTTDGRAWNKYTCGPGEEPTKLSAVFNVQSEGLYGITVLARSGVGLGERPPQPGDRPQVWVEVDTTEPLVELRQVMVGTGVDKGKLKIHWQATDKNLETRPIKLSRAQQRDGPWTPIADQLANSGSYVWVMPADVPYQFHLKVEALDKAGNVGEAISDSLIKVDLAQPKVRIMTVGPAGN